MNAVTLPLQNNAKADWRMCVCVAAIMAVSSAGASAETLRSALASAYKFNPEIEAERANLRATDEEVPRALSNYRPTVTANADAGVVDSKVSGFGSTSRNPRGYGVQLQQNVFRGFRTKNAVNSAEASIRAGRANLHAVEQTVLSAAVAAYMNVFRDQAIVRLRENNVRVLSKNLRATQDRFSAGEVTKTDVAQSRARRARAVSDLDAARASLRSSRANYRRIIGHAPRRLRGASVPGKMVPRSLSQAKNVASSEAPSVVSALYLEQAARFNVEQVWGELLPTVSVNASVDKRYEATDGVGSSRTASVVGTLSIPLYVGGEIRARLRQAKHLHVRRIQLVADARTRARELTVAAWAAYRAARSQIRSDQSQVNANQVALSGVREEEKVGQRTLLDVLDAEQELLDAQVRLATTRRDLVVAGYDLIAAVGRLTAKEMGLNKKIYDPEAHYFDVRRKWFGISITHRDGRRERMDVWKSHGKKRRYK